MKNSSNTKDALLSGNITKTMISLSIPAILGMVVIGLYNFMDAVFVGQMVTSQAMTAVKVSYPFTLINSGIATLIGTGSASVLSRAIGKNDHQTVDKIMGNLTAVVLLLSIIVTILGIAFAPQLLVLSGAQDEILAEATRYLRLVFCGSLFVNFSQSANMVMRGEGKLKVAMSIMAAGAILNIVLDPILIMLLGKENGVLGAALATVIAQFCQATYTLWYFKKKSDNVKLKKVGIDKTILGPVLSVGVSAMLMQVMSMVQQTVMYNTAAKWGGGQWQTILGASLSLQAFAFIPLWGISQGFQPAIGTNYGAKKFDRVKSFTKAFMIGATLIALLFYVPIMFAPHAMLSMFIKEGAIVTEGYGMLRVLFSSYITYGILILGITFFQAVGKGGAAAVLALLRQFVLFVPLVVILPRFFARNVEGIFYAQVVTDLIVLLVSIILMAKEFAAIRKEELSLSKSKAA